jgi:nucleoside-triphosphatase THEP1
MNVQKTCAAIVAALIIWFVAISVAMAEPPPGGQTPAPAKEPTCEEKLASATADRDAMLQDPACKAAMEQKSNPQPQPPKPKPQRFDIVCGFGTTGGQPTVLDRSTGSFHCTCKDPDADALVTGPTGSGKSTTLYTGLTIMNSPERNIVTLEDPVEYQLARVNQVQVNAKVGLTFAKGLRSILRQDPDVIMVGEIRDLETAEIAIQAALTGHLVLSTLHTNDAPSAITRLRYMRVEPFLISASVLLVIATAKIGNY